MPVVSVVMPVYNAERFLAQAIESILNQTFIDFEFIIVNDGSTDNSPAILDTFQKRDARIQVHTHSQNRGLSSALNLGCQIAKGTFIARMDADDISMPERFEKQIAYLEENPHVGVVGSAIQHIDEQGVGERISQLPVTSGHLTWCMIFGSYIAHPSVMMRRNIVIEVGLYRPEAHMIDDYDLWLRMLRVTKAGNLPDNLLKYRSHSQSMMGSSKKIVEERAIELVRQNVQTRLNKPITYEVAAVLRSVANPGDGVVPKDANSIYETAKLIQELYNHYIETNSLTTIEVSNIRRDVALKQYFLAMYGFLFAPLYCIYLVISSFIFVPRSLLDASQRLIRKVAK